MLFCIRYAPGGGETKRRIKKLCSAHGFASSDTPLPPPAEKGEPRRDDDDDE